METTKNIDDSASLSNVMNFIWHDDMWLALFAVVVMSLVVYRFNPGSRKNLKNTFYLLSFSFIGLITSGAINALGNADLASNLRSVFLFIAGTGVIRIGGLLIFRIILGSVRTLGIIEEILIVFAYFIWAMIQLHLAGVAMGEIVTTSAVITAVFAFAMKDTLGNILGGLSLELDQSLKIGDWVRIGDVEGKVLDIKWRAVSIETRNWETVMIPNSDIEQGQFKVLGLRQGQPRYLRRWIHFSIDFSVSPNRVMHIAEHAVTKANIANVASEPNPSCLLMDIDEGVAKYALRYWLTNIEKDGPTDSVVREHIYAALNRKQIRLAMSKQHIYLTNKDDTYDEHKHENEIAHRISMVSHVDLFQSLTSDELSHLAEKLEFKPYAENDVLFKEGDDDHSLYIVIDGTVNIYVEDDAGKSAFAFSLSAGEYVGEMGLMTGTPRMATAIAGTAMECFRLHRKDFNDIFQSRNPIIEEISHVMSLRHDSLLRARHEVRTEDLDAIPKHTVNHLVALIKGFVT